jgi:hypothetical protein
MAAELIIAPEAEQDIAEGYAWYEGRRTGLGEEFLSCIGKKIKGHSTFPTSRPDTVPCASAQLGTRYVECPLFSLCIRERGEDHFYFLISSKRAL